MQNGSHLQLRTVISQDMPKCNHDSHWNSLKVIGMLCTLLIMAYSLSMSKQLK